MSIIARLKVQAVQETVNNPGPNDPAPERWPGKVGESVELHAVYDADKSSPNYSFSQATPSARLTMYISNPGAWGYFEPGAEYDLVFTKRGTAPGTNLVDAPGGVR